MSTTRTRGGKRVKTVEAFAIVGKESKALYLTSNLTMYEVYYDGFVAEQKLYELIGRGLKVELLPVKIIYKLAPKSKLKV